MSHANVSKQVLVCVLLAFLCSWPVLADTATDSDDYFRQGTDYLQSKNLGLAIEAFSKAILQNPSFVPAYNNRALAYYEQYKYEAAKADFYHVLELDPNNEIANSNLGILYLEQGKYDLALRYLERAAAAIQEFRPYHATIFRNLAYLYAKVGMSEEAQLSLKHALAIEKGISGIKGDQKEPIRRPTQDNKHKDHVVVLEVWEGQ